MLDAGAVLAQSAAEAAVGAAVARDDAAGAVVADAAMFVFE